MKEISKYITRENVKLFLYAFIAVILSLMLFKKRDTAEYEVKAKTDLIQAKDEVIAAKQQFIQYMKEDNAWMDNHIKELKRQDSLLLIRLLTNQPKYIINDKKYNEIPAAVNSLDKHQLRREFAEY